MVRGPKLDIVILNIMRFSDVAGTLKYADLCPRQKRLEMFNFNTILLLVLSKKISTTTDVKVSSKAYG